MLNGVSIFLLSLLAVAIFRTIEILGGINHGFHPDSYYYIENYYYFTSSGIFSFSVLNNGYYYIVDILEGNVESLILLNQILFSITNVIIFKLFNIKLNDIKLIHIFVLFLPYRMHLSVHVLKDTIVMLCIISTYFCSLRFIALPLLSTVVFRIVGGPIVLLVRFVPKNRIFLVTTFVVLLLAIYASPSLMSLILDRSEADMGGRDFFDVPLNDASSLLEISAKAALWPLLAKSGLFAAISPHPATFILAIESIIFVVWALSARKIGTLLFGSGLIALIFIALTVNSFGAYYRYIYPFLIIDYISTLLTSLSVKQRATTAPKKLKKK